MLDAWSLEWKSGSQQAMSCAFHTDWDEREYYSNGNMQSLNGELELDHSLNWAGTT